MANETTLGDVVRELREVNAKSSDTTDAITKLTEVTNRYMTSLDRQSERDRLNKEEDRRESRSRRSPTGGNSITAGFRAGLAAGTGFSLVNLLNPKRLVTLIFGGALAGIGIVGGLRGWEVKFVSSFVQRFFSALGLTDAGRLPDAPARVPLLTRIISAFSNLENSILRFFGVSTTGLPLRDSLGRFTGGNAQRVTLVSRITSAIGRLLRPIGWIATAIDKWIIGPGAKIVGFFGGALNLGGVTSGIFRIANKILWPIGVLVAAWDAITEWQNSEETNLALKFMDSIGAFLGDFIGAPLDLLKSVVSKGLEWVGLQSAADWLSGFSFEESIGNLISSVARLPGKIVDWVVDYMATSPWISIVNDSVDSAIDKIVTGFSKLGEVGANLQMRFENTLDTFYIGFEKLSNYVSNIPDRMLSGISGLLDFEIPRIAIPYRLPFGDASEMVLYEGGKPFSGVAQTREAANNRIAQRTGESERAVQRLEAQIANRLAALESQRSDLERSQTPTQIVVSAPTSNSSVQNNQTNIQSFPSPFNEYSPQ